MAMRELLNVEFFVTTVGEWIVVGYITLLMTTVPSSDARVYSSWVGTSGGISSHRTSVLGKISDHLYIFSPVRHVGQFSLAPLKSYVPSGLHTIENVDFVRSDCQNIVATPPVLF